MNCSAYDKGVGKKLPSWRGNRDFFYYTLQNKNLPKGLKHFICNVLGGLAHGVFRFNLIRTVGGGKHLIFKVTEGGPG